MAGVAGLIEGFRARSGDVGFLDRLDDLRGRLIGSVVVVVATTLIGFYATAWPVTVRIPRWTIDLDALGIFEFGGWAIRLDILAVFVAPIEPFLDGKKLRYLSPTDPFLITLQLALAIGIAISLPYFLYQFWKLVTPLLMPGERKLLGPAIIASIGLFAAGAVFCYLMVVPAMLRFTMGFQAGSLEQAVVLTEYLRTVLRLLIAFGLAFELPIVILLGTLLGIVTPDFLASKRRHAFAFFLIGGALVTPPDVGSLVLLMIPVWLLYELSIVISRAVLARRAADLSAAEG